MRLYSNRHFTKINYRRKQAQLASLLLGLSLLNPLFNPLHANEAAPTQLIAKTHSANDVALSWQAPTQFEDLSGYKIFRDGEQIGQTHLTVYLDATASPNTRHQYHVIAYSDHHQNTETSNSDNVKTLINNVNDGLSNGAIIQARPPRLSRECARRDLASMSPQTLNNCLNQALSARTMAQRVTDLRAYAARLRRQEDADLIALGQRLFHSKSLSENYDTSCASCHMPAVGCGGDGLSLPIGVNAQIPDIVGLGRSDNQTVPSVPRNSQAICNSALWVDSMFWDQRVRLRESNRNTPIGRVSTAPITTPERTVTNIMNQAVASDDPLRLLIAQAHFPITTSSEMGSSNGHASEQAYREFIAQRLGEPWQAAFVKAYGNEQINFLKIARALAAYQASFLFIDNPFFDYVDGERDLLSDDAKRGALFFYTRAGCANCHDGAMFTPERKRGPLYPQIGINAVADGDRQNHFRMPSLLNVELTAPYGDKGVFPTLERVIAHYSDVSQSLHQFYGNDETCQLAQFSHLNQTQCEQVVGGGEQFVLNLNSQNPTPRPPNRRAFTEQEIGYLAAFLRTLTDPEAKAGSHEINHLTPPRDGGPDGMQLDPFNLSGDPL